ncbi:hypothetical protein A8139_05645 [Marinomonas primoryensis]|uniref:Uncharacterized protein n=1 Tax=Marinomonas primoryensis TaxID=178399 RepID=A0A2Z4PQ08_9GAMM|nr:hypothetical protein [Marinomonas primoryensis]AWX99534.1 hypothetical protein A8139_05645 [Marinomonas primoryensis]
MDILDIQLVAEKALGLTEQQVDELIENGEDYDTPLMKKFGVDLNTFAKIVNALTPLTPIIQDPRTNDLIHAFVTFQNGHGQIIAGQKFNA